MFSKHLWGPKQLYREINFLLAFWNYIYMKQPCFFCVKAIVLCTADGFSNRTTLLHVATREHAMLDNRRLLVFPAFVVNLAQYLMHTIIYSHVAPTPINSIIVEILKHDFVKKFNPPVFPVFSFFLPFFRRSHKSF